MKNTSVSVICTVLNEQETILELLEALSEQTTTPAEVIICDGGSSDNTQSLVTEFSKKHPQCNLRLLVKKGNRSVGRNAAIQAAENSIIAITDAGCVPQKDWLKELLEKYAEMQAPVIAGYYKGVAKNPFEEAVVPYVLVMPDQINPHTFLPATRSMLIEKRVWQALGKFDEQLSHNEDFAFANKIKKAGYKIAFAKDAIVAWFPRQNLTEFENMIERFAMGDIEANIIRPKVVFLFFRYLLLIVLTRLVLLVSGWREVVSLLLTLFVIYSLWAIQKNSKYLTKGWYWLPILQVVSDFAVIKGSIRGLNFFK